MFEFSVYHCVVGINAILILIGVPNDISDPSYHGFVISESNSQFREVGVGVILVSGGSDSLQNTCAFC